MPTSVRSRTATLCLRLDGDGRPADSDLALATRDGHVVWRGQVSPAAWLVGLRMRARCSGSVEDGLWLLARALLEAELTTHGLHRDGRADLRVDMVRAAEGTTLQTRCDVHPMAQLAGAHALAQVLTQVRVDEHVRRASRPAPASV